MQLDVALEEVETQRNGLVFIYNMTNSKYSNFDYDLSQKMLTLLKGNNKKCFIHVNIININSRCSGCYPARLKKVLIVTAPLWFKAPFKVLRLFVREKLRDRVFTVSIPQVRWLISLVLIWDVVTVSISSLSRGLSHQCCQPVGLMCPLIICPLSLALFSEYSEK